MKLVIDIPNVLYRAIKTYGVQNYPMLTNAIINGTPLPKKHGRLIDADALRDKIETYKKENPHYDGYNVASYKLFTMPTIIEADNEKDMWWVNEEDINDTEGE